MSPLETFRATVRGPEVPPPMPHEQEILSARLSALLSQKHSHSHQCRMAFGRYTKEDGQCLRCDQLKAGAAPRAGWQKDYYSRKKANDERQLAAIRNHNCKANGCGPVCTFGDW